MIPPLLIVTGHNGTAAYRTTGNRKLEKIELTGGQELDQTFSNLAPDGNFSSDRNSNAGLLELPVVTPGQEKESLRAIRHSLQTILERERPSHWGFAAPSDINRRILDKMDAKYLGTWLVNLRIDLTESSPDEILRAFR